MKKILLAIVLVAGIQQVIAQVSRTVLIEQFTGTWCGNCPEDINYIDKILTDYPTNVIPVFMHGSTPYYYDNHENGDTMYCNYGGYLMYYYQPQGFPSVMIDRINLTPYLGPSSTPQVFTGAITGGHNYIEDIVADEVFVPSPVSIQIATTYSKTTGVANATVTANFVDTASGDITITCLLVEDKVTGSAYYDQNNYFGEHCSNPDGDCEFYDYPCVIATDLTGPRPFYHRNVVRANMSPIWGSSLPSSISAGQSFSKSYSYTLDPSWNDTNVKVVAFVGYFNDTLGGNVLNAGQVMLGQSTVGIAENPEAINNVTLDAAYPNPFSQVTHVNVNIPAAQRISVNIYDVLGNEVATLANDNFSPGVHTLYWDGKGANGVALANGLYMVRLLTENQSLSKSIVLQRN